MTISDLYRKLKRVLNESNEALVNRGLNSVDTICGIPDVIDAIGVNRLPYLLGKSSIKITEEDIEGITSIRPYAFYYRRNLKNITIPNSVTSIGSYAFSECRNLKNITIPNSVTSINNAAFRYCTSFTDITIPDSVTNIGDNAFRSCSNLKNITIGSGVASIGSGAIDYCYIIENIYLRATTPPTFKNASIVSSKAIIHVPVGSGDAYKSATNWSKYASRIVEDIELS